jgi:F0F1-type ATP synthase assembly protein I
VISWIARERVAAFAPIFRLLQWAAHCPSGSFISDIEFILCYIRTESENSIQEKMASKDKNRYGNSKEPISPYSMIGVGFEFGGMVLIPAAIGYYAGSYFIGPEAAPLSMVAGLVLGFAYGIYYLYKRSQEFTASAQYSSKEKKKESVKDEADDISARIDNLSRKYDRILKDHDERKNPK